jgi:hypothetical protein
VAAAGRGQGGDRLTSAERHGDGPASLETSSSDIGLATHHTGLVRGDGMAVFRERRSRLATHVSRAMPRVVFPKSMAPIAIVIALLAVLRRRGSSFEVGDAAARSAERDAARGRWVVPP